MSEYKAYWLRDFPLIIYWSHTPRINYGNLFKASKRVLVILQSIGIMVIKSKETRVITYTCRYSSGHLIPIIQSCQDELEIKFPLEYLQV